MFDIDNVIGFECNEIEFNEELFYIFVNSSQDIIFIKDERFQFIMVNQALADLFATGKDYFIGKTDYDLIEFELAEESRKLDIETIKKNVPNVFVRKIEDKVFEIRRFPVKIGEGKIGVGAYVRDVTKLYFQQEKINKISETNRIIAECLIRPFKDIQEQLDFALHEAIKLTNSQYGYIYFYDEEEKEFTINSWTNGVMDDCLIVDKQAKFQLDKTGIWGEVVRQRKPIMINDFDLPDKLKKGYPEGHVKIHKFLSIPLFENDKIVAVIGLANRKNDYTENDVQVTTILMAGVWNSVKKREEERKTEILLERTQSMMDNHEAIMLLIDPNSGNIVEANKSAERFYGYSKRGLLNMNICEINMLNENVVAELLDKAYKKGQKYFTFPHRLKNGEVRVVDVYSNPIEYDSKKLLYSIIFDVTSREEATKQIEYLAYHDYLTNIYNRRYFEEEFKRCNNKRNFPLGVIMGDVDGLKKVNDTFGHLEGDKLLIKATTRIKQCLSSEHTFARIGGDEFAIIVKNTNEEKIKLLVNMIEHHVNDRNGKDENEKNQISVSFGYGIQRKENYSLDAVMIEAESMMYNKKNYNSRSVRNNTVNIILNIMFEKSEREKKHSDRVASMCSSIAEELKWDIQSINRLRVAGVLHDIGKIGISENILNKSCRLDKNEWNIMKSHPQKGARILESNVEFKDIAQVVLYHHERYDGTGYPSGLKGREIPIESRIIAVADAYDAMINERSYRRALRVEDAISELIECSGGQFDPEIVDVFVNKVLIKNAFLLDEIF